VQKFFLIQVRVTLKLKRRIKSYAKKYYCLSGNELACATNCWKQV